MSALTLRCVGPSLVLVPEDVSACPPEPLEYQRLRLFVGLLTIDPSIRAFPSVFRPFAPSANAFPR